MLPWTKRRGPSTLLHGLNHNSALRAFCVARRIYVPTTHLPIPAPVCGTIIDNRATKVHILSTKAVQSFSPPCRVATSGDRALQSCYSGKYYVFVGTRHPLLATKFHIFPTFPTFPTFPPFHDFHEFPPFPAFHAFHTIPKNSWFIRDNSRRHQNSELARLFEAF